MKENGNAGGEWNSSILVNVVFMIAFIAMMAFWTAWHLLGLDAQLGVYLGLVFYGGIWLTGFVLSIAWNIPLDG